MLFALGGHTPLIDPDAYVAPTAVLIGRVHLLAGASVWFGAVLRGDNEPITLGRGSNVQDNAVLHTDPGFPLTIGAEVTIGHLAMLHGCTIGDGTLVGMGAMVLNGARIGKGCLIGARAFVGEGKEIPDGSVVMGMPGRIVGEVTDRHRAMIAAATLSYRRRAPDYRAGLQPPG